MRKLVTVRTVDAIRPIPGADAIECAIVEGWTVVIKKGEFAVGDRCVFLRSIHSCRSTIRALPSWRRPRSPGTNSAACGFAR